MSDHSAIEWTDATWNPVTGCTEVTPGCDHCYAKAFSERFRGTSGHYFQHGFDIQLRPEKLTLPLRWRKPRRVFVNSMSDLFHQAVPDEYIARVFAVMAAAPQHTFQLLTKRHGRMRSLLSSERFLHLVVGDGGDILGHGETTNRYEAQRWVAGGRWPLPNVWIGVSVEDQDRADLRIPALLETPAAVRWLSCEPLLGPLNLDAYLRETLPVTDPLFDAPDGALVNGMVRCVDEWYRQDRVDWLVAGGESGLASRPMQSEWARSLRDQCIDAGVPFLFKQWGGRTPKANGRELDGRTWDEYPAADLNAPIQTVSTVAEEAHAS